MNKKNEKKNKQMKKGKKKKKKEKKRKKLIYIYTKLIKHEVTNKSSSTKTYTRAITKISRGNKL